MSSSNNNEGQENNNNNNGNNNNNRSETFPGSCQEMKGFTITSKNAGPHSSQFVLFSKALTNMAKRFEKDPRFIKYAIENNKDPPIPSPMSFSEIQDEVKAQFGGRFLMKIIR